MSDIGRRLDKLEREMGDDGDQDAAYRPTLMLPIVYTKHWRASGSLFSGEDADSDDGVGIPPSHEVRAERDIRQEATLAALEAWVTQDAKSHDWRESYNLLVTIPDEDKPEIARFQLPWRSGPWRSVYSQVIDEMTDDGEWNSGKGYLQWPDCAAE